MTSSRYALFALVLAMFVAPISGFALDTSAVETQITTDGTAAINAIGLVMIGLAGVAVVVKWAKAAVFG